MDPSGRSETLSLGRSPSPNRGAVSVLLTHTIANVLIQAVWFGMSSTIAVLARKRFGAGDWQTVMITAAPPTLLTFSIFWNEFLRRTTIRRYLIVHWAFTMLPVALAALSTSYWHVLACYVAAAVGAAGWSPVAGDLLKRFYADQVRGRALGIINAAMFVGMMGFSYAVGRALDVNENAFRIYFPMAALSYGGGVLMFRRLIRATHAEDTREASTVPAARRLRDLLRPLSHLREVLRADRVFYRYEAAFMTYGLGWMICNALLPVLATDRLKMSYTEFAASTQVIYPLCMLLMTWPMGWVMDRLGPTRTSALSFAWLALYPIGLLVANSVALVGVATAFYGTAMAGVHIAWLLGPVALAPSPDRVAQYVAIHATLVGLRGIVAQGLGMAVYRLSGNFAVPFIVAAGAFVWAAWQMRRLTERMQRERRGAAGAIPAP